MTAKIQPLQRPAHWRSPWRLRPRNGPPRCLIEQIAQWAWRNAVLLYCAAGITVSVLLQLYLK